MTEDGALNPTTDEKLDLIFIVEGDLAGMSCKQGRDPDDRFESTPFVWAKWNHQDAVAALLKEAEIT
jgi:hypothetical protein